MFENYDALLVVSFGGPEGRDDVIPFLENVLRGRNVPRERMLRVADHYYQFGGISPINAQNRRLIESLKTELAEHAIDMPIYWGNRNWHPMLVDTLRKMDEDGVRNCLAFVTSAYSSYSGCRQYREDIARAQRSLGQAHPEVSKLRVFYNHPDFVGAVVDLVQESLGTIPDDRRKRIPIVFTAHSLPQSMADHCEYVEQLKETCQLVIDQLRHRATWRLVFQSRSGSPTQPWLEPDILDYLRQLKTTGNISEVAVVPVGFVSDHMEIVYDLDTEAKQVCDELGVNMLRVPTVGTQPRFIQMIRKLIQERRSGAPRLAIGSRGPSDDYCPEMCCLSGRREPQGSLF